MYVVKYKSNKNKFAQFTCSRDTKIKNAQK